VGESNVGYKEIYLNKPENAHPFNTQNYIRSFNSKRYKGMVNVEVCREMSTKGYIPCNCMKAPFPTIIDKGGLNVMGR